MQVAASVPAIGLRWGIWPWIWKALADLKLTAASRAILKEIARHAAPRRQKRSGCANPHKEAKPHANCDRAGRRTLWQALRETRLALSPENSGVPPHVIFPRRDIAGNAGRVTERNGLTDRMEGSASYPLLVHSAHPTTIVVDLLCSKPRGIVPI